MNAENRNESIARQTAANIAASVIYQITAAVCSLILPRYILLSFGSDVNGILQSVSQLLNYTVIMECGIGGLILAAFYKPLADGDKRSISDIFNYSRDFFSKLSYVYMGLVLILAVLAKVIIRTDYDFAYVSTLTLILGISYYFTYYFAMTHRLLIRADQKIRIVQGIQSITLILNTVICVVAIRLGFGIHSVKAVSAVVFLLNPMVFRLYVKRRYSIVDKTYDKVRDLPRKRDGIAHQVAFFVHMNTDIVLISIACGTKEVSVYSVYNSIIYAVESFFTTISDSISAAVGNMIAKGEKDALKSSFEFYRIVNTAAATFVCVAEAVLILPFVSIYTKGVTDAMYVRPAFAYMMIAAQWFFCMRIPYNNIISAAGHYGQTKNGAYMEVILNMAISLLLLPRFGICGVAFGTMIAMAARAAYMAWYLSRHLLRRRLVLFIKDIILNGIFGVMLVWLIGKTITISADHLFVWGFYAAGISIGIIAAVFIFNVMVDHTAVVTMIKRMRKKQNRRRPS